MWAANLHDAKTVQSHSWSHVSELSYLKAWTEYNLDSGLRFSYLSKTWQTRSTVLWEVNDAHSHMHFFFNVTNSTFNTGFFYRHVDIFAMQPYETLGKKYREGAVISVAIQKILSLSYRFQCLCLRRWFFLGFFCKLIMKWLHILSDCILVHANCNYSEISGKKNEFSFVQFQQLFP